MGMIFSDTTPEQLSELTEQRRKEAFIAAWRWPLGWAIPAERHKLAADHLYEIAHSAHEREMERMASWSLLSGSHILEGEQLSDWKDYQLIHEYLLLGGYSIECLFKGILLMDHPDLVGDDYRIDRMVTTHDLVRLASDCKITLSDNESLALDLMRFEIEWGKYPAPKKLKDMPSPFDTFDPKKETKTIQNPFHERRMQRIVNSVYSKAAARFVELREERRAKEQECVSNQQETTDGLRSPDPA